MKVLYLEAAYGFGGSLTGLLELFRYLPDSIEPILVTPFDPWSHTDHPPNIEHEQVDIAAPLPKSGGHWLPGLYRYYADYLKPWQTVTAQMIRKYQPDLVHANNSLSINYGVGRAAKKFGVPSICHQKDFEYPGKLMQIMASRTPFDHHIAMSRSIQDQLVTLGVPESKCSEIFDPMTPPSDDQLAGRRATMPQAPPVVAMHSMIIEWKGQHVFIDAIAELAKRGVTNFRPMIAGSPPAGEPGYLDSIKQRASEKGVLDRIEFPGHQKDVYEYLTGVDIAVHCSIDPEPFGRVVPEVMLMGIPGVVSTGGGPQQYVIDGEMGFHAPCGDAMKLADAIERLLAMSPEQRDKMGETARQHALAEFTPQHLSNQMMSVYERLLDR